MKTEEYVSAIKNMQAFSDLVESIYPDQYKFVCQQHDIPEREAMDMYGYLQGSILYIGFTRFCIGPYSLDEINMMRNTNPEVSYVEPGYKNYDCYIPSLIRIYK